LPNSVRHSAETRVIRAGAALDRWPACEKRFTRRVADQAGLPNAIEFPGHASASIKHSDHFNRQPVSATHDERIRHSKGRVRFIGYD